jgi:hypothetical protein
MRRSSRPGDAFDRGTLKRRAALATIGAAVAGRMVATAATSCCGFLSCAEPGSTTTGAVGMR